MKKKLNKNKGNKKKKNSKSNATTKKSKLPESKTKTCPFAEVKRDPNFDQKTNRTFLILVSSIVLIILLIFILHPVISRFNLNINPFIRNRTYRYNNFEFNYEGGMWATHVQASDGNIYKLTLMYGPKDLQEIGIAGTLSRDFYRKTPVYLVLNPNIYETGEEETKSLLQAYGEVSNIFGRIHRVDIVAGYTENCTSKECLERPEDYAHIPIIDCDSNEAVIYFKKDKENDYILFQDNCVIIAGHEKGMIKAAERYLYKTLMIMD